MRRETRDARRIASNSVMAKLTIPRIASITLHVRKDSVSLKPPIFAKIQNPLSFIHPKNIEP